jgi:hypothetical protein
VVFPKRPYRKLPTLSRATLHNVHVFATNPVSTKSREDYHLPTRNVTEAAKLTLLGGELYALPSPHVNELVPTPETTIVLGPMGLAKMPELVPAMGMACALWVTNAIRISAAMESLELLETYETQELIFIDESPPKIPCLPTHAACKSKLLHYSQRSGTTSVVMWRGTGKPLESTKGTSTQRATFSISNSSQ